jgi:PAS domain S-box-containing protein
MTAVHPEDREAASKAVWDGVRLGQSFTMEARSLRALDGTYRWHFIQVVVLHDAEGEVLKFVGTATDIDDQKRAEEALKASENNFRQILDSIPGLVATMSAAGEMELTNRPFLEYFGRTLEEMKDTGNNSAVHPDDMPPMIAAFTHSITTGAPYDMEHRCRRADGVYRWFQSSARPVRDTSERITGWYVLITDIDDRKRAEDELKRSEARYRLVVENSKRCGGQYRRKWHHHSCEPRHEADIWARPGRTHRQASHGSYGGRYGQTS